jgi:hypothetical protein
MKKLGAVLAALAATLVIAPAASAGWGGGGTVTAFGVGPLEFDFSTSDDVAAWAGYPDKIVYWDEYGIPTSASNAHWEITQYHYPGHGYTWYSFVWDGSEWLFEQFDTSLQRFQSIRGTKVGMTYWQAQRNERVPWHAGCGPGGFFHERKVDGQWYAVGVEVDGPNPQSHRVTGLHAFGPQALLC